jgi:hypothetical protein
MVIDGQINRGKCIEIRGLDLNPRNGRDDTSADGLFLIRAPSRAHVYQLLAQYNENKSVQNGNRSQRMAK